MKTYNEFQNFTCKDQNQNNQSWKWRSASRHSHKPGELDLEAWSLWNVEIEKQLRKVIILPVNLLHGMQLTSPHLT